MHYTRIGNREDRPVGLLPSRGEDPRYLLSEGMVSMDKTDAAKVNKARRRLFLYGFLDKVGNLVDYKWKFFQHDRERCQKTICDSVLMNKDMPKITPKSHGFTMDDLYDLFKRRASRDNK